MTPRHARNALEGPRRFVYDRDHTDMSEPDTSGKKVGVFGSMIAALGLLFAKVGAECGAVAKGVGAIGHAAPLADDGLRLAGRGAALTDDALLAGARGAGVTDDALRAAGRGATPWFAEEGMLGAERAAGSTLLEEAASRAPGAGRSAAGHALEDGLDIATDALDLIDLGQSLLPPGDDDYDAPTSAPSAAQLAMTALFRGRVERPALIAALPATEEALARTVGGASRPEDIDEIQYILKPTGALPIVAAQTSSDIFRAIADHRGSNPLVILAYSVAEPGSIAPPEGPPMRDTQIHNACLSMGMNCVVLTCDPKVPSENFSCPYMGYRAWLTPTSAVTATRPMSLSNYIERMLLERRKGPDTAGLLLSRVAIDPRATQQKIIRSRPKKARPKLP